MILIISHSLPFPWYRVILNKSTGSELFERLLEPRIFTTITSYPTVGTYSESLGYCAVYITIYIIVIRFNIILPSEPIVSQSSVPD